MAFSLIRVQLFLCEKKECLVKWKDTKLPAHSYHRIQKAHKFAFTIRPTAVLEPLPIPLCAYFLLTIVVGFKWMWLDLNLNLNP